MLKTIDAKGQNCPIPVIMAKKEIDNGAKEFIVEVDNEIAVENLQKLAGHHGFDAQVEKIAGGFAVCLRISDKEAWQRPEAISSRSKAAGTQSAAQPGLPAEAVAADKLSTPAAGPWAVFVSRGYLGGGSEELGKNLLKMFFYTLTQSDNPPQYLLFMNGGVKVPVFDEQIIEHLQLLEQRGCEVLVCGTCLKYYDLADQLKVGTVSNMYEIVERMQSASKILSL